MKKLFLLSTFVLSSTFILNQTIFAEEEATQVASTQTESYSPVLYNENDPEQFLLSDLSLSSGNLYFNYSLVDEENDGSNYKNSISIPSLKYSEESFNDENSESYRSYLHNIFIGSIYYYTYADNFVLTAKALDPSLFPEGYKNVVVSNDFLDEYNELMSLALSAYKESLTMSKEELISKINSYNVFDESIFTGGVDFSKSYDFSLPEYSSLFLKNNLPSFPSKKDATFTTTDGSNPFNNKSLELIKEDRLKEEGIEEPSTTTEKEESVNEKEPSTTEESSDSSDKEVAPSDKSNSTIIYISLFIFIIIFSFIVFKKNRKGV